jgi:hypothetical protein
MAIAGTALTSIAAIEIAIPPATFEYFATCTLHISASWQALLFVGSLVLALPFMLTFATAAVRNQQLPIAQRIPWAIGLLMAGPLAIPSYWWLFLREPRA